MVVGDANVSFFIYLWRIPLTSSSEMYLRKSPISSTKDVFGLKRTKFGLKRTNASSFLLFTFVPLNEINKGKIKNSAHNVATFRKKSYLCNVIL